VKWGIADWMYLDLPYFHAIFIGNSFPSTLTYPTPPFGTPRSTFTVQCVCFKQPNKLPCRPLH